MRAPAVKALLIRGRRFADSQTAARGSVKAGRRERVEQHGCAAGEYRRCAPPLDEQVERAAGENAGAEDAGVAHHTDVVNEERIPLRGRAEGRSAYRLPCYPDGRNSTNQCAR